jgi:deoxyribonuclease V
MAGSPPFRGSRVLGLVLAVLSLPGGRSLASEFDPIARLRHFAETKREFAEIGTHVHNEANGITEAIRLSCHSEDVDIGGGSGGDLFVAVDGHYLPSGGARAAAVVSADAAFSRLVADRVELVPEVQPYQPGQFYRRELPPLHAVLDGLAGMALLVVDGYADLDPDGRPGLGAHAHAEFGVPVIGVAKSAFRTATHAIPVLSGTSARPLYVTAAGMPRADAADLVRGMVGEHRIPDALRRVDTLARNGPPVSV